MTNEEKLLRAIGEIDDALVKEASSSYKRRFTPLTRGLTVAASIAVVSTLLIASGLLSPNYKNDVGGDASSPPEMNDGMNGGSSLSGSVFSSDYGYIYVLKRENNKITLELQLHKDVEIDLEFTLLGKNSERGSSAICTTRTDTLGYELVLSPQIFVGGEPADKLPSKMGYYSVTIDFSVIENTDYDWYGYISVSEFGDIGR